AADLLSSTDKTEQKVADYLKLYNYDYDEFKKVLNIRRVDRTDYLEIIYQSENPQLSAYVVNTLGVEFLNYYKNLNRLRNTESAENIQQMLNLQQLKVDSLTNEWKIARISQGTLDPVEQSKNAMETAKDLQIQLSTTQSEYNLQSGLYQSYETQMKEINALLSNNRSQEILNLLKRKDEIKEKISQSSGNNDNLNSELNIIDGQLRTLTGNVGNRSKLLEDLSTLQVKSGEAKARMNAASVTVNQLSRLISLSQSTQNGSPKTQVEIDAIQSSLDIENANLKNLREKYSQAEGLIRDDPTENFRQTLFGEPDDSFVPKNRIMKTGLAGITTLVILILIIILREIFSNAIKVPFNFRKLNKLNLIGVFNKIKIKKNPIDAIMLNELEGKKYKREIIFKDNIKKLRNELSQTGKQVFLFTSTQEKVGKTLILQSLAYSFILQRKKVLIIDLNFQNNSLTKLFNATHLINDVIKEKVAEKEKVTEPAYAGAEMFKEESRNDSYFTEDFSGQQNLPSEPFYKWMTTDVENQDLQVLGCKSTNASPTEVLEFEHLDEFILRMKRMFDYILIEASALNKRSDSFELFPYIERVVTVFSAKNVIGQADLKSIESIEKLERKHLGAVLNAVEMENIDL
ncbi:MAG TPA: hypothetical protein VF622_02675, partial [Segetibacter sp.]